MLAPHLKRLLNIDITADNLTAEPGVTDYVQVQLSLFSSLFTPTLLEQMSAQLEGKEE